MVTARSGALSGLPDDPKGGDVYDVQAFCASQGAAPQARRPSYLICRGVAQGGGPFHFFWAEGRARSRPLRGSLLIAAGSASPPPLPPAEHLSSRDAGMWLCHCEARAGAPV